MTKKLLFLFLVMGSSLIMAQNLSVTTTVCGDASSVRMTGPWWQWGLTSGQRLLIMEMVPGHWF